MPLNMGLYLSQCTVNGQPPIAPFLGAGPLTLQKVSDPVLFRRYDQNRSQVSDSVVDTDRLFWNHTWSYAPFGIFNPANGDGGEIYTCPPPYDVAYIRATQDASSPKITDFGTIWPLMSTSVGLYSDVGWTELNALTRACRATVTYQAAGYGLTQIAADTVINEHYGLPNQQGNMERHYMAELFGLVCWESYGAFPNPENPVPPAPVGAPPVVAQNPLWARRLWTTLVPQISSVTEFGWPPAGWVPP